METTEQSYVDNTYADNMPEDQQQQEMPFIDDNATPVNTLDNYNVNGQTLNGQEISDAVNAANNGQTQGQEISQLSQEVARLQGMLENQQSHTQQLEQQAQEVEAEQAASENFLVDEFRTLEEEQRPFDTDVAIRLFQAQNKDLNNRLNKIISDPAVLADVMNLHIQGLGEQQVEVNGREDALKNEFEKFVHGKARSTGLPVETFREEYQPVLDYAEEDKVHLNHKTPAESVEYMQRQLERAERFKGNVKETQQARSKDVYAKTRESQMQSSRAYAKPKKVGESVSLNEDDARALSLDIYQKGSQVIG